MREPWWLQYLKSFLLEILFVTTWSVFQNQVTYLYVNGLYKNIYIAESIRLIPDVEQSSTNNSMLLALPAAQVLVYNGEFYDSQKFGLPNMNCFPIYVFHGINITIHLRILLWYSYSLKALCRFMILSHYQIEAPL